MYILGFKKKSSPPQPPPFKSRKINFDSIDDIGFNGDHIEVNPIEFFNNAEYPFIHLDSMNMLPGVTTPEDHGYYILYDKNTKGNNRRFYTSFGSTNPVDISYSTEINKWILTDTGKQDGGIIESTTLEGPWSKGKYGNEGDLFDALLDEYGMQELAEDYLAQIIEKSGLVKKQQPIPTPSAEIKEKTWNK